MTVSLDPDARDPRDLVPIGVAYSVTLGKMLDSGKSFDNSYTMLPYIRAANIQDDGLQLADVNEMPFTQEESRRLDLRRGDLLVVEGGAVGTTAIVGRGMPGWSFQKTVNRVRPVDKWSTRYLAYVLRAYRDAGIIDLVCNGSTIPHLTAEKLKAIRIPFEPPGRQRSIADYLDRETARIDRLIEEQWRLIEILQERKRAIVSDVIAHGLDGSIEQKDSCLPGAGLVPVHWDVLPLRHAISFQEGPGIMAVDFRDKGVPLLRVSSVRTTRATLEGANYLDPDEVERRWSHFRVDLGDLLISASASMGTVSEVTVETVGAVAYTGIIRLKPGRMQKEFIRWFVVSDEFSDQVTSLRAGSTIQHFGPTHLCRMHVALPPAYEQRQIAAHLEEETAKIDELIAETERFIELARERRSALITAAVTGQIDLREMA